MVLPAFFSKRAAQRRPHRSGCDEHTRQERQARERGAATPPRGPPRAHRGNQPPTRACIDAHRGPLLDIRTLFRHADRMSQVTDLPRFTGKVMEYPDGSYDIMASNRAVFGPKAPKAPKGHNIQKEQTDRKLSVKTDNKPKAADLERARRRARANVRRLALANQFRWFVTLTIDPKKIDSYDPVAVTRKLSQWLSNRVKRDDLRYILVPEKHESGRIHYHGFFSDHVQVSDSGHKDSKGHTIYNLPQWDYGFTTAIELYGDYHAAIGYACKYIGKESEKIGGRWYYSGGKLEKPVEKFVDIVYWELMEMQDEEFTAQYGQGWMKATPGGIFAGVNGLGQEDKRWNTEKVMASC